MMYNNNIQLALDGRCGYQGIDCLRVQLEQASTLLVVRGEQ